MCDTRPPQPGTCIITLVTDRVDAVHDQLTKAGIAVDGPPRHNPEYEIYQFFATDPDGYVIEVQRFDDPNWGRHG